MLKINNVSNCPEKLNTTLCNYSNKIWMWLRSFWSSYSRFLKNDFSIFIRQHTYIKFQLDNTSGKWMRFWLQAGILPNLQMRVSLPFPKFSNTHPRLKFLRLKAGRNPPKLYINPAKPSNFGFTPPTSN